VIGAVTVFDVAAAVSAVTLVAVWLLYPLVMGARAGWARRWRPPVVSRPEPIARAVSIVVATRDEPAAVRARVEDCLRATNAPARLEVVVAFDPKGGPTPVETVSSAHGTVRYVRGDEPGGKAATLNAGVRAASGDIIVFTDTSQRFHPAAIGALVDAVRETGVGAVSGSLELASNGAASLAALYWRLERWLRQCEAEVGSSVGVTGAIYAIRKSLWKPLPAGLLLDDLYTPMQIALRGYRVGFVTDARAWETRLPSPSEEYRRKTRTLTGVIQLCAWLPALLNPVRNPLWTEFLFHKLLRFLTPYCAMVIGAWCLVTAWPFLTGPWATRPSPAAVAVLCVLGLGAARAKPLRALVAQACLLQAAVMVATFNGLRGRWDVWQR
jgi:cellulose synthase/poly-beta-1,6-N-acetylglucosamine synthase-like glycosyltransferase